VTAEPDADWVWGQETKSLVVETLQRNEKKKRRTGFPEALAPPTKAMCTSKKGKNVSRDFVWMGGTKHCPGEVT